MSFIIQDDKGNDWLPAYTAFNKVMGKNALVIPFRTVFIDGEWWLIGDIDVARQAYPIERLDIEGWMSNPPEIEEEEWDDDEQS